MSEQVPSHVYLEGLAAKGDLVLAIYDWSLEPLIVVGGKEGADVAQPSLQLATAFARAIDAGKRMEMGRVRRIVMHSVGRNVAGDEDQGTLIQTASYDGPGECILTSVSGREMAKVMYASQQLQEIGEKLIKASSEDR